MAFKNDGRSAAIITQIRDEYLIEAKGATPYALDPAQGGRGIPAGTISTPDRPYIITQKPMTVFNHRVIEDGAWNKYGFWYLGYVRYIDIVGNKYITGYCGKFDPLSERLVLIGDDRYNFIRAELLTAKRKWWQKSKND